MVATVDRPAKEYAATGWGGKPSKPIRVKVLTEGIWRHTKYLTMSLLEVDYENDQIPRKTPQDLNTRKYAPEIDLEGNWMI